MITEAQKEKLDGLKNDELRSTISVLMAGRNENKHELIAYFEHRLDALNVDTALVENCDLDDFNGGL